MMAFLYFFVSLEMGESNLIFSNSSTNRLCISLFAGALKYEVYSYAKSQKFSFTLYDFVLENNLTH